MKTLTPQVIKDYAEAHNLKWEEHFPQSKLNPFPKTFNDYEIGIQLQQAIWFWWKSYPCETEEIFTSYLFFQERYNTKIGTSIKAYMTGEKALEKILNN